MMRRQTVSLVCILAFPGPSGTACLKRSCGKTSTSAKGLSKGLSPTIDNWRTSLEEITQPPNSQLLEQERAEQYH
ncbi:hypothetical protein [Ktedonobacter robiniae]|uniref:Secreted protein n=1 Tax=Ktedonobacter robiniae TaxID=2778365 RepID=A0ABQ3V6S2_9CHLR|nr:hypothetical protein [Ktedonobacter robiniae]GHO60661.1 hypothetical protein KSB_91360 [Ktedonobacter robiniae]